jgi:hypothetical protein
MRREHSGDVVTEPLYSDGKRIGEISVNVTNAGRYLANYKVHTVRWQELVSAGSLAEALQRAKKRLTGRL